MGSVERDENDLLDKALTSVFRSLTPGGEKAADDDEPVPTILAGCEVTGILGRGGMGVVYRAMDPKLGRPVAIKTIARRYSRDRAMVARFLEEARICSQLQHPCIVPIHELGQLEDGRDFFTMKVVEGETLAELLSAREKLQGDRRRLLEIFHRVCQAMAYAHSKGIHHGDLKPSNVMVGAFGETQVMDWGFARLGEAGGGVEAALGPVLGTPAYMAPEQARGQLRDTGVRTDVFSLGGILCELLTGDPPYCGATRDEVYGKAAMARLDEAHRRLDACSGDAELVSLVRRCLAPNMADRPSSAAIVTGEIERFIESADQRARTLQVQAAAADARAAGERRAKRLTVALTVCVALGVLLALVGHLLWTNTIAERRAASSAVVAQAMERAVFLEGQARLRPVEDIGRWKEALAAVTQVRVFANDEGVDELLRGRVEELAARVTKADSVAAADGEMLSWLEHVCLHLADDLDWTEIHDVIFARYADHGLDFDAAEAPALASRIEHSAISAALTRGIDAWIRVRLKYVPAPDAFRDKLAQVAALADRDESRAAIRRALLIADKAELLAMAARSDVAHASPRTAAMLASSLSAAGEQNVSIEFLRRAVALFPGDFWLGHDLGSLLRKQGSRAAGESVRLASIGVALRPKSAHALADLAHALMQAGDYGEAEALLARLRRTDPTYRRAWHYAATIANRQGEWQKAQAAATAALTLKPDDIWSRQDLAAALLGMGDDLGAAHHLEIALGSHPNSLVANTKMASIAVARGWLDKADKSLVHRQSWRAGCRRCGGVHAAVRDLVLGW